MSNFLEKHLSSQISIPFLCPAPLINFHACRSFPSPWKRAQQSTYFVCLSVDRTLGWQLAKSSLSHGTARIEACIFQEILLLLLIRLFACTTPDVFSPHVYFPYHHYVFPKQQHPLLFPFYVPARSLVFASYLPLSEPDELLFVPLTPTRPMSETG